MVRGCSDSDSEEERHDRFKSERNPGSAPAPRRNLPTSLDDYTSRKRSPVRQNKLLDSRHRSRYSEERRYSPSRRGRTPERWQSKESRDRKLPRMSSDRKSVRHSSDRRLPRDPFERSTSIESKHSKHKRSHDKHHNDEISIQIKDDILERRDHREIRSKDSKHRKKTDVDKYSSSVDCAKKRKSYDESEDEMLVKLLGDTSKDSDNGSSLSPDAKGGKTLQRYYDLVSESPNDSDEVLNPDEKKLKKHKRSRDRSESHKNGKKRRKDKKHKKRHEKRKSECESEGKTLIHDVSSDNCKLESSIDLTKDTAECGVENIDSAESNTSIDSASLPDERVSRKTELTDKSGDWEEEEEGELSDSESDQLFGPALPPRKQYGAEMPADVDLYGPTLPPVPATPEQLVAEEEEDLGAGDVIGPLPAGMESAAQSALDTRASLIKYQMDNKRDEDSQKREAWMVELPAVRGAQIGLGPRKFRANAAPDMSDRSSWTDRPQDKARKQLLGDNEDKCDIDSKKLEIIERNKEMEALAKKSSKKSKSLLDMHQKELKKKKKKEAKERGDKPIERRPFSRENDLQTNKFDEAQKRSIIKKAQLLDSRFSVGESKFL